MVALFPIALERVGTDEATGAIHDVAVEVGEGIAGDAPGRPGVKRLLTVLNQSGYEPVTDPDGTIRLRNCPFHALIAEHQSLVCSANLAMAQGISDAASTGSI